ncbi:phosphoglycerate mutase-like protein [Agrocybe pediades]|nr:phosphoglycerate mutase-like protein [Agrocybe pediades]
MAQQVKYESFPGFFAHDGIQRTQTPLPAIPPSFGLLDHESGNWTRFLDTLSAMNKEAPGVSYKFFLLSRHGQGSHNVAEAKYGTEAWDDYWSTINGDGELTWGPDPKLTNLGILQAEEACKGWETEAAAGLPHPDRRYCSPLSRALHTCSIMFKNVYPDNKRPVVVWENCREDIGLHTCDKRDTKSYIASAFPDFVIEDGFTEEDELWHATLRETAAEITARARGVIDRIFREDGDAPFISITAHGGFINAFLAAVGRDIYPLPTGGILPIVVKRTAQN